MSKSPKKPLSAYIRYYGEKFGAFQQKYPSYSTAQLTKVIASEWTKLSAKEKEPYLTSAAEDKKRYEEAKQQFMNRNPTFEEKKKLYNGGKPRAKFIPDEKRRPSRQLKNRKKKEQKGSEEEGSFEESEINSSVQEKKEEKSESVSSSSIDQDLS